MKILVVTQVFFPDTIGGAGRYVRDLAVGLQARGHQVCILTIRAAGGPGEDTIDGLSIVRYGPLKQGNHVLGSWGEIRRLFRNLHRRHRFDLLVVHQPLPACALLMEPQARALPWVYHFHSPWAEEVRVAHPPHRLNLVRRLGLWVRWAIEHQVLGMTRCRITLSESMKGLLQALHRVPSDTVAVVPGCVDLERFHPVPSREAVRERLGLPLERRVLLTVRNLVPRMNLDGLIQAMSRVVEERPECLLLIGGSGPLAQPLQDLVKSAGLEAHVRLVGIIPEADLPQWYQAADVFIMPSKALEGFGLATLEALACGTPVVGTPVGGTQELLSQLDPSLLCRDPSPEAMATTLLQALDRLSDPLVHQELSSRCRAFASRFSIGAMAEGIEGLYAQASKVKVLHVHTLPVISGSGLNTFSSMCGQRDAGFDVELACAPPRASEGYAAEAQQAAASQNLAQVVEQAGMRVRPIRHLYRAIRPWHDLCVVFELWRLMRRGRYTIVHTHNSKAGIVGRVAARFAGVPIVVHTYHSCVFRYPHLRPWQQQLFLWTERLVGPFTTYFTVVSDALRREFTAGGVARPDRVATIYSGVDLDAFRRQVATDTARRALGLSAGDLVIGSVARLDVGKGHQELFEAMAQLAPRFPHARLLCIGDGPIRGVLERHLHQLNLADRVLLVGDRHDIPQLTHLFDIAVLASHYEGMGRVLLEAQAAGKPVVATRVGGIPDVIRDGETGYLVPPGDSRELAERLQQLLADAPLRQRMGQAAVRWVDERFSSHRMGEQIVELYQQLLRRAHVERADH